MERLEDSASKQTSTNGLSMSSKQASEKKRRIQEAKKKEHRTSLILLGVLIVGVVAGIYFLAGPVISKNLQAKQTPSYTKSEIMSMCMQHGNVKRHYHAQLTIHAQGSRVLIPAEIGITSNCMRQLHTHDDSGEIHIEAIVSHDFTLGDFFTIWNVPFNKGQVLKFKVDETHVLRMFVNGIPNNEWENYVLRDGDNVLIEYVEVGKPR